MLASELIALLSTLIATNGDLKLLGFEVGVNGAVSIRMIESVIIYQYPLKSGLSQFFLIQAGNTDPEGNPT